jgi:hypothetical protein
MAKPWQNNMTGYVPSTVGVKTNNGFGDVSTLNCFHLIFPLWKTSVPMVVAKTGLSLNAIFTTLSSQQICETFNLIKPVCVGVYILPPLKYISKNSLFRFIV